VNNDPTTVQKSRPQKTGTGAYIAHLRLGAIVLKGDGDREHHDVRFSNHSPRGARRVLCYENGH
jgi:hypothetical protein